MGIPTLFWDEDTQRDFIHRDGALVVPGADALLPNLLRLTEFARTRRIPIAGSVDAHLETDAEISARPDYTKTFPPHCISGRPGQLKVSETAPLDPLWIENRPLDAAALAEQIRGHSGELLLKKQTLDVFDNPNTAVLLDTLQPAQVVVYGVATDFCVRCAVEGLLARKAHALFVVEDAIEAIDARRGDALKREWRDRGVTLLTTRQVLARQWT